MLTHKSFKTHTHTISKGNANNQQKDTFPDIRYTEEVNAHKHMEGTWSGRRLPHPAPGRKAKHNSTCSRLMVAASGRRATDLSFSGAAIETSNCKCCRTCARRSRCKGRSCTPLACMLSLRSNGFTQADFSAKGNWDKCLATALLATA